MIINGKENIIAWFDSIPDARHWILYQYEKSDSGSLVLRSLDDDHLSKEASRTELKKALDLFQGRFTISAMVGPKRSPKGDYKINIEIEKNGSSINGMPQQALVQQVSGMSADQVQAEIKKAIDAERARVRLETMEKELKELKAENKELSAEANSFVNTLGKHLGPHTPAILAKIFPQQPGIAGINDGATATGVQPAETEISDEEHERLTAVINVFMAIDPDGWLTTLEKMAAKLKTNPALLNTLKAFL